MCRHVPYGGPNFCKRKDRRACSSNINELEKETVYRPLRLRSMDSIETFKEQFNTYLYRLANCFSEAYPYLVRC